MAEKKRQHFVPQFYMRNFANDKGGLTIYNISKDSIISDAPYSSQCYKDYFYGKDLCIEDMLSKLELNWNTVIKKMIAHNPLDTGDIEYIKQFALFQRQRTLGEYSYRKEERHELLRIYGEMLCKYKGFPFDKEVEKICAKYVEKETTPAESVGLSFRLMKYVSDLELLVITYNTKKQLIFSDVPVIAINQFFSHSIGYGCMGLVLLFPISPHQLAVLYDKKMYPCFKQVQYTSSDDEDEVDTLNQLQYISAEKAMFALLSTDFPVISKSLLKYRANSRDTDKVGRLGPKDHLMLITEMRTVLLPCSLSFAQVRKDFENIPFPCREAPPRFYDNKWEKKLKLKIEIMTNIALVDPTIYSELNLSARAIKDGCTQMYKCAKKYWRES